MYQRWLPVAVFFAVVNIGIPLALIVSMIKMIERGYAQNPVFQQLFRFIYSNYGRATYSWAIVLMMRDLLIPAVTLISRDGFIQCVICSIVQLAYLLSTR